MTSFKQWLEDAGEVHPRTNDDPRYAERGIRSDIVGTDKPLPPPISPFRKPEEIFGVKKEKKGMVIGGVWRSPGDKQILTLKGQQKDREFER